MLETEVRFPFATDESPFLLNVFRITSYNVCYTKLLRIGGNSVGGDDVVGDVKNRSDAGRNPNQFHDPARVEVELRLGRCDGVALDALARLAGAGERDRPALAAVGGIVRWRLGDGRCGCQEEGGRQCGCRK